MGCLLWLFQFLCFLLLCHLHFLTTGSSSSMQLCPHDQSIALLQFKRSLSINPSASSECKYFGTASYPKTDSWKKGTDCCSWDGVTCNILTGHVIGLDLNCSWLYGLIRPNSSLFHLPHLKSLNLAFNDFNNSRISPQFGWFASLTHFNLSSSSFSGHVPHQISHLSKLISLDLSWLLLRLENPTLKGIVQNLTEVREFFLDRINISLVAPASFMNFSSSLTSLRLSDCQLRANFPSNIFYRPKLQLLYLSYNSNLKVYFPKSNWSGPLEFLDVSGVLFFGELPNSIGNLQSLKYLSLSGCNFTGSIPSSFKNLRQLTHLDLSENNFSKGLLEPIVYLESLKSLDLFHCNIRGSIPSSFKNLRQLTHLDLSENNFSKGLPEPIVYLESLKSLDLFHCNITGSIPSSFKNLVQLTYLDLSYNNFYGGLPEPIVYLESLNSLDLSHCNITGSIPSSFKNLVQLTYLDLSYNNFYRGLPEPIVYLESLNSLHLSRCNFTGSIPSSLKNLVQLTYLDLSHNNFTGSIPNIFGNFSKLVSLSLYGNNFGGQLPSSIFNLSQLETLDISSNQLVGSIPYQVGRLPNLISLDLSDNFLNGTIPSWLYTLPSLESMSLSNNQLTGHINEFLSKSLEQIDLYNNKLHGPLPSSIFELVNLNFLFLSSNNLSGNVESYMFSKLKNLQFVDLSYNSLSFNSANLHVNYTLPYLSHLYFSSCNMSEIPNFLKASKNLQSLDLSNNKIGNIPKWMWDVGIHSLSYLNLSHNLLTSVQKLPWRNLGYLDLHSNLLQGPVPIPSSHQQLVFFSISQNKLTGEISSLICNASSLTILDISHNNLSGMLPRCIGNFSEWLSVLDLRVNNFHGTIPIAFSKRCRLRNLNFDRNQLNGSLPRTLVNCRNLEVLDLGNNKIDDKFPYWLGSLPELQVLVLRSNKFHGLVQGSKASHSFPKLQIFDLSNNDFEGPLPTEYIENLNAMIDVTEGKSDLKYMREKNYSYDYSVTVTMKNFDFELVKILTILTSIDLSKNRFEGEIPQVIGKLHSLKGLNLSHNNLGGHIPQAMGYLTNLEWLDLSSNKLVGKIPEQLADVTSLEVLNLSHNQLNGSIPQGKQFNTFDNDSYEGNLGLCGFPLTKSCSNVEPQQPPQFVFHEEDDSESVLHFGWKVVLMGYGCGMVIGLAVGYLVFRTGKPKWFVKLVEGENHHKAKRLKKNTRRSGGRRNLTMEMMI